MKKLRAKSQELRANSKKLKTKKRVRSLLFSLSSLALSSWLLALSFLPSVAVAAEKWQGVDESVVEKYAKEQGREAKKPLINTDQGDLLLFVFLVAGTAAGFAAGYFWRILMVEKAPDRVNDEKQKIK
ncbi:MAG TPA: hypothetical protein VJW95_02755 [Dissulfurispiraceae bacterium]|nr:hypothetical protein [Dissulfurispiraceae bacterium]